MKDADGLGGLVTQPVAPDWGEHALTGTTPGPLTGVTIVHVWVGPPSKGMHVTSVASFEPNQNFTPLVRSLPVTVTVVPPVFGPLAGVTLVRDGKTATRVSA